MIEYLEHAIDHDPAEAYPPNVTADGIQFAKTGDAVIDKWEADIAAGKTPDFTEAFSAEDKVLLDQWLTKGKKAAPVQSVVEEPVVEEFNDNYDEHIDINEE